MQEMIFALKTWFETKSYNVDLNSFNIKHLYGMHSCYKVWDKSELTGSAMDAPMAGRPVSVTTEENQSAIAQTVVKTPRKLNWKAATELGFSQKDWYNASYTEMELNVTSKLGSWIPQRWYRLNSAVLWNIPKCMSTFSWCEKKWSDEVNFELSGQVNRHNFDYWNVSNPHIIPETSLNQPGVSVWGAKRTWSFCKSCSFCFSRLLCTETGRRGATEWSLKWQNLTLMDFFLWHTINDDI